MKFVVADLDPLDGHAAFDAVMLGDVLKHFLEGIYAVSAIYSMKKKGLLVLRIDSDQIKTLYIIFLLEIKDRILLTDAQFGDDLFLQPCYFYVLIVA